MTPLFPRLWRPRSSFVRSLILLLAGILSMPLAMAQEEASAAYPEAETETPALHRLLQWSNAQFEEFTGVFLPDTQERRTWRLSLSPRFGDVKNRDHLRLPVGVVYGFNDRTEGRVDFDFYVPNPFKDGDRTGIANIRPSFKYQWVPFFDRTVAAATGVRVVRPLGGAPPEINHGVNRYSTYMTFSRPSRNIPALETFLNISYDVLVPSSTEGYLPVHLPQDDFVQLVVGGFYRVNRLTYGLAVSWAHTLDSYHSNYVTVTPGILVDVPPRWVFNSPGLWQVGTSVELRRFGSETDIALRVRVRWEINFGRAVRALSGRGDRMEPTAGSRR